MWIGSGSCCGIRKLAKLVNYFDNDSDRHDEKFIYTRYQVAAFSHYLNKYSLYALLCILNNVEVRIDRGLGSRRHFHFFCHFFFNVTPQRYFIVLSFYFCKYMHKDLLKTKTTNDREGCF